MQGGVVQKNTVVNNPLLKPTRGGTGAVGGDGMVANPMAVSRANRIANAKAVADAASSKRIDNTSEPESPPVQDNAQKRLMAMSSFRAQKSSAALNLARKLSSGGDASPTRDADPGAASGSGSGGRLSKAALKPSVKAALKPATSKSQLTLAADGDTNANPLFKFKNKVPGASGATQQPTATSPSGPGTGSTAENLKAVKKVLDPNAVNVSIGGDDLGFSTPMMGGSSALTSAARAKLLAGGGRRPSVAIPAAAARKLGLDTPGAPPIGTPPLQRSNSKLGAARPAVVSMAAAATSSYSPLVPEGGGGARERSSSNAGELPLTTNPMAGMRSNSRNHLGKPRLTAIKSSSSIRSSGSGDDDDNEAPV